MERFSHRDHVLLGYSPQKSFGSPRFPPRTSDVDFHDVFGGPPRRSSIHDWRHSLGDSNSSRGDEETSSSRSPWSGLSEKPVFGEEIRNRRRYQSDDFFDDIFRGDESSTSTPRKLSRDPFSSAPTSRIQSPAHPQASQSEQSGGSSMPPVLSLPTKLAKEKDFPPFASPTRSPFRNKESASTGLGFPSSPRASLSRVLTQIVQGQDGLSNDARPFYRQSRLSHELSLNEEGSPKTTKSNKQDSSSSEVDDNSSQFHFSIYKWACKGVPLVVPLRGGSFSSSKCREKTERPLTELPVPVLQGVEAASKSFWWEHEDQDISLILTPTKKDGIDSPKIIEELVPAIPGKPITNFRSIKTNVPASNPSQNSGKENNSDSKILGAEMDISLCEGREKKIPISKHEAHKPDLKPLRCLFKDDSDSQENDKIVEQARMKEGSVGSKDTSVGDADDHKKVKRHVGKRITLNLANPTNSGLQDSPISPEDKLVSNRVKGKVKQFVKIFNQETPSQPITNAKTRGQRTRVKDIGACKTDNQESVSATKADGKEVTNTKTNRKLTDAPVMVDQVLKQSVKPHLGVNNAAHKIDNTCCERKDTSALHSESISKISEAEVDTIDDSHSVDLNCTVDELCHDQDKQPQPARHNEELQVSDVKIRQWSNGKEGNIRSLLSTMQYVLWPESGWKPVPLVDIIEGNSVKKAYQKALLCLHPDKLQQKGAAPHQKYIAEKVFDILQEAWTHFNSLGSF